MTDKKSLILKAKDIKGKEQMFSSPWNSNSEITGTQMGRLTGLERTGVNLTRIPPGKESFVYHAHHCEEEWIYILSGQGVVEINDEESELEAGDFVAFPTPSVAHHLRNPYDQDLVYLMGGEKREVEIIDYPRLEKRMFRRRDTIEIYNTFDAKTIGQIE